MDTDKKRCYGAYDSLRKNNRLNALASFGIGQEKVEKVDKEMKEICGLAGKKWSINCFDDTLKNAKKSS